MKHSRKKWILFTACVILTGLGSYAMLRVLPHPDTPAAAPASKQAAMGPAPDAEHELKELGVQLKKKPGHTPVLMRMAQIERDKGQLKEAAAHLREVVKNEPANAEAHLELGRNLYEDGDVNGGIAETEKVLKIDPMQVDALYNLGAIYANLGNSGQARSYWQRAVQAGPNADSGRRAREALAKIGGV